MTASSPSSTPRARTLPALKYADGISEEEKWRRLQVLNAKQREIQSVRFSKHLGEICEVMVEGDNIARSQLIGRTSQNKILNFTVPAGAVAPVRGDYTQVHVTRTFPNSLVGEMVR